eukprot:SAG11_NODE_7336_length_1159_cov_1.040566_1_plen_295_part_01
MDTPLLANRAREVLRGTIRGRLTALRLRRPASHTMETTPPRRELARLGCLATALQVPASAAAHPTFPWGRSDGWPQMVPKKGTGKPKLAIVSTVWRQNSHSEHMGDCFLHGWGIGGEWHEPALEVVSMYVDQDSQGVDRERADEFGFTLYDDIAEALRRGGDSLAVDAIFICGEHGQYTRNEFGQHQYPRYRFFKACTDVFKADGRSVPIFSDKHLSWKYAWAEDGSNIAARHEECIRITIHYEIPDFENFAQSVSSRESRASSGPSYSDCRRQCSPQLSIGPRPLEPTLDQLSI